MTSVASECACGHTGLYHVRLVRSGSWFCTGDGCDCRAWRPPRPETAQTCACGHSAGMHRSHGCIAFGATASSRCDCSAFAVAGGG